MFYSCCSFLTQLISAATYNISHYINELIVNYRKYDNHTNQWQISGISRGTLILLVWEIIS